MANNGRNQKKKIVKIKLNFSWKSLLLYGFLAFFVLFMMIGFLQPMEGQKTVPLSEVIAEVKRGEVSQIVVSDNKLTVTTKKGVVQSFKETGANVYQLFKDAGVELKNTKVLVKDQTGMSNWINIISSILPVVLMVAFFYFLFRQARGAQESIFSFGQSKAKLFSKDTPRVTFADVAGVDEAKQELTEIVDFLKNPGKYRAMGARTPKGALMVGPSGTGKCITGDTIIWTNKGLMEIREIPRYYYVDPESHEVYGAGLSSFDIEKTQSSDNFASYWFDLGEQKTVKIRLAQGFSLEGTPEHPVIVMTHDGALKFRKIDDLKKGDYVAIQFGREMFGNLQLVDEDTAYLMGLLTGDGNLSHASRIGLTSVDDEIIDFFKTYVKKRYSKSAITYREQSYLVASWDFKKYLYQMGMSYLLSFDKVVPPTILQSPKQIQINFLQGLFDTDGSVEKARTTIEYITVSEKLARQIQTMLLNLGIVTGLNIKGRKENGYYRSVYRINITGASFATFGKKIGFKLTRKQKLLEKHIAKMKRFNTNIDIIPGIANIIEESWRVLSKKKLSNEKLSKTIDKVRRRTRISRQTLNDYITYASSVPIDVPHLEYLRSIFEANLFFSPVVEKQYGVERVYDFTVPKTHSFLGNGFINHNTLLARATAGEAGVPFFSMAGSEFMEMLVGVGASVTGDTPVLIKENGETKLLRMGSFIDKFYKNNNQEGIVPVGDIYTLGFDCTKGDFKKGKAGFWGYKNGEMQTISSSAFKKVSSVFRHKINETYEIHYLGGVIKTTADHSIFVRRNGRILPIATKDLKKGDLLVEPPLNIRLPYIKDQRQRHKIIAHKFSEPFVNSMLDVWNDDPIMIEKYMFAASQKGLVSQYAIADQIGVSQATVGHWQNNVHFPRSLSKKLVKFDLPDTVAVTPELMRIFGYYTAEGRGTTNLEFTFSIEEKDLHLDLIQLMKKVFNINPVTEETKDNTLRIKYYSAHLGRFFIKHCGNGSHNKHVPEFIWDLPREYFFAFLEGYWKGDGYKTKSGKLSMTSVSKQLILELSWLCSMHGIKVGIKHGKQKGGRVIKNRSLPDGEYWNLIIGKTTNPFLEEKVDSPFQFKRAIVQKIVKKSYSGFVYDFCGVENEAFFGGEKPVLLHNSRVRDLFNTAKKAQPAIIFIDEIDAIGRQRGFGIMGGHDEREQTLNQILVEMDGFTPNEQLIVMAATNRPDVLDPALVRPGRFDRRVVLDMPDVVGRKAILSIHARGKPFANEVDWEKVAKRTVGFSGADLENMLNEAAILAARLGKKAIDMSDLEEAATKVKLGPEKRRLQTDEDRKMTAYHEAGHALVSWQMPHMDPVHRISIVSRGLSLGHTMMEPIERVHETKTHLLEQISVVLGGRAAENLVFQEMTTGASDDIAKATEVARTMVVEFGMSDLGPMNLDGERRPFYEQANISPEMAAKIDEQIKKITDTCYQNAIKILSKLRAKLDLLAGELLKKETIESEEFIKLIGPKAHLATAKV